MKFLHTSDLHIGLKLCEFPMNEDIKHLLAEITDIAVDESCGAVVIAGDIYDRANPAPESVAIFDEFVTRLVKNGVAVVGISGNHDSAERIAYLSDVLSNSGVYFSPAYDGKIKTVSLNDEYGRVNFILLPFVRPSAVALLRGDFDGDSRSYNDAVRFQLSSSGVDYSERNVAVAHHFVAGEGELFDDDELGGVGRVFPETFDGIDYTALGHLHMPRGVRTKNGNIWYSGSPLRCSFAELGGEKSVNLVTLGEKGDVKVEQRQLHPIHELREISGTYDELTSLEFRRSVKGDDYFKIVLKDEADIPDAVMKLRIIYPNLMRLSYDNERTRSDRTAGALTASCVSINDPLTPAKIFAELYELQNNAPPSEEINRLVLEILAEIDREGEGEA